MYFTIQTQANVCARFSRERAIICKFFGLLSAPKKRAPNKVLSFLRIGYKKDIFPFYRWIWTRAYSITAEPCMESATCCGMELIAKQSYGIKPQENAPLVMPYTCGDYIHANAWFHTKPAAWIKNDKFLSKFVVFLVDTARVELASENHLI